MARREPGGTIRKAVAADAEEVALLHARSRAAYYRDGGAKVPAYFDDRVAWWIGELVRKDAATWVAENTHELVGIMHSGWGTVGDRREFELIGLYVAPEHWGTGVGGALYDVFVTEFTASGADSAVLEVWSNNDRAIGVYERRGWVFDGTERPAHEGTSYRLMRLALADAAPHSG
jgi:ribosomal protein S18 acetylase RimI-like enzyme